MRPSLSEWIEGKTKTGKSLPLEEVNKYRTLKGLPPFPYGVERNTAPSGLQENRGIPKNLQLLPGNVLKQLLDQLGLSSQWCAGCQGRAAQMNAWGHEGCRGHFDVIVGWMEEGYARLNWLKWTRTVAKCARTGLVFQLNPFHPCRSIVEEVLRRCSPESSPIEQEVPRTESAPPVVVPLTLLPVVKPTEMIWSYGVTTVPARRATLLPTTLASLAAAGFDKPRLFVDGCDELQNWRRDFDLEVTCRYPKVGVAANWILTLHELILREPNAHRYAVFQDDCITYKNLRQYLEKVPYPDKSYLNLITELENEGKARTHSGWFPAAQLGRGAVALVFSREAATVLMSHRSFIERAQDTKRGHIAIDGGILYAMQNCGWKEYCHNPSLVQHIGHKSSTMGHGQIPQTKLFRGEGYDALNLL